MIQIHILIPSVQNLLIAQNYLLRRHFMVIWLRYLVFNGSVKWIREMKQQIKYEARSQPVEVTHHPKSQMTLRGGETNKSSGMELEVKSLGYHRLPYKQPVNLSSIPFQIPGRKLVIKVLFTYLLHIF